MAEQSQRAPVLWREITWIILFKLVALTLLWYLFFSPGHRVEVTPARVQHSLFSSASGHLSSGDDAHA